jgi:hypothetical protein
VLPAVGRVLNCDISCATRVLPTRLPRFRLLLLPSPTAASQQSPPSRYSHRAQVLPFLVAGLTPDVLTVSVAAFGRFRESVLQASACRDLLIHFWRGHGDAELSSRYGKQLVENRKFRQEWSAKIGLGFEIPKSKLTAIGAIRNQESTIAAYSRISVAGTPSERPERSRTSDNLVRSHDVKSIKPLN